MKIIKGFTLVELIVSIAVMMIVITISGSMLISGLNIFLRSAETLQQKNITESVCEFISEKLMFAESVSTDIPDEEEFFKMNISDNGQLIVKYPDDYQSINAFGDFFYNSYSISYQIDINNGSALINVYLYDSEGNLKTSSSKSVIILNNPDISDIIIEDEEFYVN